MEGFALLENPDLAKTPLSCSHTGSIPYRAHGLDLGVKVRREAVEHHRTLTATSRRSWSFLSMTLICVTATVELFQQPSLPT